MLTPRWRTAARLRATPTRRCDTSTA